MNFHLSILPVLPARIADIRNRQTKIVAICLFLSSLFACQQKQSQQDWAGMDTQMHATLYEVNDSRAEQAFALLERETQRLEGLYSDYDSTSSLYKIRGKKGDSLSVPLEVWTLLKMALETGDRSGGAFNPNLHQLKKIWGMGGTENPTIPDSTLIERFRPKGEALSRPSSLVTLPDSGIVILNADSVFLDLGAIAKGYTVDRFHRILDSLGIPIHLVMAGGEVRVGHAKAIGEWRIGVRHPRGSPDSLAAILRLEPGEAVSTSGDYERFFIKDGIRYHHIFNPETGWPARASVSVTVISTRNQYTDALATCLFVLGPERAGILANFVPWKALWFRESPEGLCSVSSPGMQPRLSNLNVPACRD